MKETPSKTDSTKLQYIARAKSLVKKCESEKGLSILNTPASEFVAFLLDNTSGKTTANWRQVKASCVYYFEQIGMDAYVEQIRKLGSDHTHTKSTLGHTSSKKKKSVTEKERKLIFDYIMATIKTTGSSMYDQVAVSMFSATLVVGLRPCEWQNSIILNEKVDGVALNPPILKVKNAKATNGRSFGEYRYIGLSELEELSYRFIEYTIHRCKNPKNIHGEPVGFNTFYDGLRLRFRKVVSNALGNKSSCISMYSARHQLIADLKKSGLSRVEIACIVGHANDLTATEHYGKKIHGESKGGLPLHNKADVPKIRQIYRELERVKVSEKSKDK